MSVVSFCGPARALAAVALLVGLGLQLGLAAAPRPVSGPLQLSQAQVAGQFLRAVLRANYAVAYASLAPEVRRAVRRSRFEAAARPLWAVGQQRRNRRIELYKLGLRLGDGGASRFFYAFRFAADSGRAMPGVQLEVTFRDTASRAVLGFGLRPVPVARP